MPRTPIRDGWRVLLRAPESILAEIAWRWAFSAAFWGLLFVSFHQYFSHIEISRAEYALLKSLEPFTFMAITIRVLQAFVAGVRDMWPILFPALTVLWLALATIGRASTIRALTIEPQRTNWATLLIQNLLRLLLTFASILAYVGSAILVSRVFAPSQYAAKILVLLPVIFILATIWSLTNWVISLAQIFAVKDTAGVSDSFHQASDLYQSHSGALLSSGLWFSFLRGIAVIFVTFASLAPLQNIYTANPHSLVFIAVCLTLLYCAMADALNIWRLGVYISLTEPEPLPAPLPPPVPLLIPPAPEPLLPAENHGAEPAESPTSEPPNSIAQS